MLSSNVITLVYSFFSFIRDTLVIILLFATGLFLSVKTGFIQIRKFPAMLKYTAGSLFKRSQTIDSKNIVSPFKAVSTALGATIGTGSIAGIATAIVAGGPGAIFWMWVSAFFGMTTKYCEILLSIKFRHKTKDGKWTGGPMYYIEKGLNAPKLAIVFAILTAVSCFGTGNTIQSNSISEALFSSPLCIDKVFTAKLLTCITAWVILGGMKRIMSINEKLVPFMAVFYIGSALAVLFVNKSEIPDAFNAIFSGAMNIKSVGGGVCGYGMLTAIKTGFSKGILSNEAGLGSAPIAHGASDATEARIHGFWGMFEVFFTTIIICTLSALVVLTSGLWESSPLNGSALSAASFDSAIRGGGIVVTVSTVLFALSSILGWAYYGEVSIGYLSKGRFPALLWAYRIIYVCTVYIGAVMSLEKVWIFAETLNAVMAIPNLVGIIGLSNVVKKEIEKE